MEFDDLFLVPILQLNQIVWQSTLKPLVRDLPQYIPVENDALGVASSLFPLVVSFYLHASIRK